MKNQLSQSLLSKVKVLLLFSIFILSACSSKSEFNTAKTQEIVVYFVRHAEKDLMDNSGDPNLTEEGIVRAENLRKLMQDVNLSEIYATNYKRTINTVTPTANQQKLNVLNYDGTNWEEMLDEIRLKKGKSFLICGHSNTLVPMIQHLGGDPGIEELGHDEYDKLFKLTIKKNVVNLKIDSF